MSTRAPQYQHDSPLWPLGALLVVVLLGAGIYTFRTMPGSNEARREWNFEPTTSSAATQATASRVPPPLPKYEGPEGTLISLNMPGATPPVVLEEIARQSKCGL